MYPSVARLGASRSPQHVQVETPCRRVGEPHRTAVWLKDGVRILERVNFGKKIIGGSKLFGRKITQALTERENRAYFAASVPDRGDEFFAEFDTRYAQLLAWQAAGTDYLHLLVAEGGEVVGRVNLTEVADGTAELGYRIAQKAAGQGLATATVRKVRELAATEYGLNRLRARVTLNNPASRKVLEHNGFVAVGELTLNGKPAMSYICELR